MSRRGRPAMIRELTDMTRHFVDLQAGVVWDGDELKYVWNDAKSLQTFKNLINECDMLFNDVDRFLKQRKTNHDRFETSSKYNTNNPYAYAARCARLIGEIQDTAVPVGMNTSIKNLYCINFGMLDTVNGY